MGDCTHGSWDSELSAVVAPHNGRWPIHGERTVGSIGQRSRGTQKAGLRWARWDRKERTLSVVCGHALADRDTCHEFFIYLPKSTSAPALLYASDGAPPEVGEALDAVAERSRARRMQLSILVEQAVCAVAAATDRGAVREGRLPFLDVRRMAVTHGKELDVVVCLAAGASRSLRRATVLDPFPRACLDAQGEPDFDGCRAALESLPTVREIAQSLVGEAGAAADGVRIMAPDARATHKYSIRATDRPPEAPAVVLQLDHGDDPEFQATCDAYGSVEAFHGSALENFHCILRCGLKSFSGNRERMRTGDIFGEGVYMSSELPLARSFAPRALAPPTSELGAFLSCVAICQVALHPSVRRKKETAQLGGAQGRPIHSFPHTYYVAPDASHIRVIGLLIFADGTAPPRETAPLLQNGVRGWMRLWWRLVLCMLVLLALHFLWGR